MLCALAAVALDGCAPRPVKVGFPVVLTGLTSKLGVHARNGAMMAVDEINAAGGIRGRPLELLVRDEGDDPDRALAVDKELAELGAVALVGHMASRAGLKAAEFATTARLPLLSPTISSTAYSGKDDYFFRIIGSNELTGRTLAAYARKAGYNRVAVAWELANKAYTESVFLGFKDEFEKSGGLVVLDRSFTSSAGYDFKSLTAELLGGKPDAIFMVASPFDTASVCQILQAKGLPTPVLACMWAMTADLFSFGGRSVDRLAGVMYLDLADEGATYRDFKERYRVRYGEEADFGAAYGYDAVKVMAVALAKARRLDGPSIKASLLASSPYKGLQGEIVLDENGDCSRRPFIFTAAGGSFRRVP